MLTAYFDNTAGLCSFDKWLKEHRVVLAGTLLVMENTGVYHRPLWAWCTDKKLSVHIGNVAHIKWNFGIARGKNDQIDSGVFVTMPTNRQICSKPRLH